MREGQSTHTHTQPAPSTINIISIIMSQQGKGKLGRDEIKASPRPPRKPTVISRGIGIQMDQSCNSWPPSAVWHIGCTQARVSNGERVWLCCLVFSARPKTDRIYSWLARRAGRNGEGSTGRARMFVIPSFNEDGASKTNAKKKRQKKQKGFANEASQAR